MNTHVFTFSFLSLSCHATFNFTKKKKNLKLSAQRGTKTCGGWRSNAVVGGATAKLAGTMGELRRSWQELWERDF